jgi:hypothetical protein
MIAHKVIDCINIIKIEGTDILSKVPYKNIVAITCVTDAFNNDIEAINKAKSTIVSITGESPVTMVEHYSPEFYPCKSSETFFSMKDAEIQTIKDNMPEDMNTSNVMIPITHVFDDFGDYIQYKVEAKNEVISVLIKTAANVNHYIKEKHLDFLMSSETSNTNHNYLRLH